MKLAAVCVTYKNPVQLGWMVQCFLEQDYEDRELIILDDAGQYGTRRAGEQGSRGEPAIVEQGDRWRLYSTDCRWPSLGQKRNAAAALVSPDCEAICVWDDDDIYLPWALRASAAALETAPWSRPSQVLHESGGRRLVLNRHRTGGLYHGGWAYRRDAFEAVGGYPVQNNGEDQGLMRRLQAAGVHEADPIALGVDPFYIYRWGPGTYHLSGMGAHGYQKLASRPMQRVERLKIEWPADYHQAQILPEVLPRPF